MKTCLSVLLAVLIATPATADAPSVTSVPQSRIWSITKKVDELVKADLARHKIEPNRRTDDATFLRRVYLDIIGRIPTRDETVAFLASNDVDKRSKLIDKLLDSPGYVSRHFNFWADILRIKSRLRQSSGLPYIDFVKTSLRENKPYDQFVRELIASDGAAHERDNGATGYYVRDTNMPEDNMSNTVQVFLGTQLVCAQCHDHPFDRWTQMEFYEMLAFTNGTQTRYNGNESMARAMKNNDELRKDKELRRAASKLMQPLRYGVSGSGTGIATLPKDYKYDDGKPNETIKAAAMFGEQPKLNYPAPRAPSKSKSKKGQVRKPSKYSKAKPQPINSRVAYARWMTSGDNPRFTTVIVNRLWKLAMGRAMIEPIDDMMDDSKASNPELQKYLEQQMIAMKYDMKQFLRVVYNTQTYQRMVTREEVDQAQPYHFQGPILRRMGGEQLWDSMVTLVVDNLDERSINNLHSPINMATEKVYNEYAHLSSLKPDQVMEQSKLLAESYQLRFKMRSNKLSKNEKEKAEQRYREVRQLLSNAANSMKMSSTSKKTALDDKAKAEYKSLSNQLKKAQKQKDKKAIASIYKKIRDLKTRVARSKSAGRGMDRASELTTQPANAGHLLREFGQSDREQIEAASFDPAATQALVMLNGFVDKQLLINSRALLMQQVAEAETPEQKINTIFLSTLNRYPNSDERSLAIKDVQSGGNRACNDWIWTLLNTHEFMFVQ